MPFFGSFRRKVEGKPFSNIKKQLPATRNPGGSKQYRQNFSHRAVFRRSPQFEKAFSERWTKRSDTWWRGVSSLRVPRVNLPIWDHNDAFLRKWPSWGDIWWRDLSLQKIPQVNLPIGDYNDAFFKKMTGMERHLAKRSVITGTSTSQPSY